MNLNQFNPPYLLWKEDFISNTFFLTIGQYYDVRTLMGQGTTNLIFDFHISEALSSADLQRFSCNFNLFTLISSGTGTWTYQCRIDTKAGIYNFKVELDVDSTIDPTTVLLNSITSSGSAEAYTNPPQTDFTNPTFVSDNCYNPTTDASLAASTPISRSGAVSVVFSEAIKINNPLSIQIYKGLGESNYSIVGNGSNMVPLMDPATIINDTNGVKALYNGVTATDITPPVPLAADVIQSNNYIISSIPTVSGSTLTITPSSGVLQPGKYVYYIFSDAITDLAGNFFGGKNNIFQVS